MLQAMTQARDVMGDDRLPTSGWLSVRHRSTESENRKPPTKARELCPDCLSAESI
jgi:hypothetical protein